MAGYNWNWGKAEPELRSLYEWLDGEAHYANKKSGIVGLVILLSYSIALILCGMLCKSSHLSVADSPDFLIWPMVVATSVSGVALTWFFRSRKLERKAHWQRLGMAQTFVWQLYMARWQGMIKETLGADAALALNAAAADFLRCRSAFKSPAWLGVSSDSAWASIRSKAEVAMTAGMSRLMTVIGHGGAAYDLEVQTLLAGMHEMAEEVVATTDKLAVRSGLGGDVSDELRHVLNEMRILNDAHDEVMNLDVRP